MILEYIPAYQKPLDQQIISNVKGLNFLVLDKLYTYRGHQGADVTLLIRRVR